MADATWSGTGSSTWIISNPSVTKDDGTSWGTNTYATAQSSTDEFDSFTAKWNTGDATFVIGISTLAYITANGTDELGIQYGFKFRPYSTNKFQTVEDGVEETDTNYTIDSDTEFKLTYSGGTMKWYVDDVERHSSTVSLSGTFYLWTNNNTASTGGSIQAQYTSSTPVSTGTRLPPPPIVLGGL